MRAEEAEDARACEEAEDVQAAHRQRVEEAEKPGAGEVMAADHLSEEVLWNLSF